MGGSLMRDLPLVRGARVSKTFTIGDQRVRAVRDATFTIERGSRIALVGPSGSGKSTLVHLIAGLDQPSGGSIIWPALGTEIALRPGPIGLAFQGPSLLPPLTVLENAALPMILAGHDEEEANDAARELLAAFDVAALVDRLPEELSGGQSQRVGLARAFVGGPQLILADEPTGQLDHDGATRVLEVMLSLADLRRTALVLATHDSEMAARLDTRWSMRDGTLTVGAIAWSS
jgi:ABC-type lipoprotein export system ATPase subunit